MELSSFSVYKAVLLNDVENLSILGLEQGCILLFTAISKSLSKVIHFFAVQFDF